MKYSSKLLVENREYGYLLAGVFGVVDGGPWACADYNDVDTQNEYYEGYTCTVEVSNIFVFYFTANVIHAAMNYPGSLHDVNLAASYGLLHQKMSEKTPAGMAIIANSASSTTKMDGKIVKGRKNNELCDVLQDMYLGALDIIMERIMPSERQSAEWGVRAIKGPFGILRHPLPPSSRKRFVLLQMYTHLLKLRTREVGLNQIRTVYVDEGENVQPWVRRMDSEESSTAQSA